MRVTNKKLRKKIRKILLKEGTLEAMDGGNMQRAADYSPAYIAASEWERIFLPHLGGHGRHLSNNLQADDGSLIWSSQLRGSLGLGSTSEPQKGNKMRTAARAEYNIGPMIDWKDPKWTSSPIVTQKFRNDEKDGADASGGHAQRRAAQPLYGLAVQANKTGGQNVYLDASNNQAPDTEFVEFSNNGEQPLLLNLAASDDPQLVALNQHLMTKIGAGSGGGDVGEHVVGEIVSYLSTVDPSRTNNLRLLGYQNTNAQVDLIASQLGVAGKLGGASKDAFKGVDVYYTSTNTPYTDIKPTGSQGNLILDFTEGIFASSKASFQADKGKDNRQAPGLDGQDMNHVFGLVVCLWVTQFLTKLRSGGDKTKRRIKQTYGKAAASGNSILDPSKSIEGRFSTGVGKVAKQYAAYVQTDYEQGAGSDVTAAGIEKIKEPLILGKEASVQSKNYNGIYDLALDIAAMLGITTIRMNIGAYNLGLYTHGTLEDVIRGNYRNHRYFYILRGKADNNIAERTYDASAGTWSGTDTNSDLSSNAYTDHIATIMTRDNVRIQDATNIESQIYVAHQSYSVTEAVTKSQIRSALGKGSSQYSAVIKPGDYQAWTNTGADARDMLVRAQKTIAALKLAKDKLEPDNKLKQASTYEITNLIDELEERKTDLASQLSGAIAAQTDDDRKKALQDRIDTVTAVIEKLKTMQTFVSAAENDNKIVANFFTDVIEQTEDVIKGYNDIQKVRIEEYIVKYNKWLRQKALYLIFRELGPNARPSASKPYTLTIGGETVEIKKPVADPGKQPGMTGENRLAALVADTTSGVTLMGGVIGLLLGGIDLGVESSGLGISALSTGITPDQEKAVTIDLLVSPVYQDLPQQADAPAPIDPALLSDAVNALMARLDGYDEVVNPADPNPATNVIRAKFETGTIVKKLKILRSKITQLKAQHSDAPPQGFTNFIYTNVIMPADYIQFDPTINVTGTPPVTDPASPGMTMDPNIQKRGLTPDTLPPGYDDSEDRPSDKLKDEFQPAQDRLPALTDPDETGLKKTGTTAFTSTELKDEDQRKASGALASKISGVMTDIESDARELKLPEDPFTAVFARQRSDAEANLLKQNLDKEIYDSVMDALILSFNTALMVYLLLDLHNEQTTTGHTATSYDEIGGMIMELALKNGDYKTFLQLLNENVENTNIYDYQELMGIVQRKLQFVSLCLEFLKIATSQEADSSDAPNVLQFPKRKIAAESRVYNNILKKLLYTAKKRR